MKVPKERKLFRQEGPRSNPYRMMLWALLILAGLYLLRAVDTGRVQPLFLATLTPTRTAESYSQEGAAFFTAGNLSAAIAAYEDALRVAPDDAQVLAELARIQTYSSSLLTANAKRERLQAALENINLAAELDPFNSDVHAVRALVLDWNAGAAANSEEQEDFLLEAAQAAVRAVQLDNQNALALAYQAEVLVDQQQWTRASQLAELALAREPNLMDTHRVLAYVLESTGQYSGAIEEYQLAAQINPNLTFLYISIAQNYRQLELYEQSLEYFDRAASINEVLGIEDPLPYLGIANTYSREGEFFAAALNAQKALEFDPTNPDIYGRLGIIFFRARNYESSIPVLRCAVSGCSADQNEEAGVAVVGLPLDNQSLPYYYTFGSVLAALNQCNEALPIFDQLTVQYAGDSLVMGIVEEGLVICESFEE